MRTIAIVQARLGSTRLPRKALTLINDKPMLAHVMERAAAIPGIHGVCLAIPYADEYSLSKFGEGHYVVTGPEADVLERFMLAAEITNADRIVRITADCPLLDPFVAGSVIALHDVEGAPYVSNVHPRRTWPDGLDVEVFTREELERVNSMRRAGEHREHVTTLMRKPDSPNLESSVDLGRLKWSVDTPLELNFVRKVTGYLQPNAYRMVDTMEAIRQAGLWDSQPESDDWRKTQ